jgi:ankyrin repeat protein
MNLSHDDENYIPAFKPGDGQWELNNDNILRIDPQSGETILHNYCRYINSTPLEVFKFLLETNKCNINSRDLDNNSPLYYALKSFNPRHGGNVTALTFLLSQDDINVNAECQGGFTLLHSACFNINSLPLDIFKYLVQIGGASFNLEHNNNYTPLQYALFYFDQNRNGVAVLAYLLGREDVNLHIEGLYGRTLLHWACKYINLLPLYVFQHLIGTHHCDMDVEDENEDTPIYIALRDFKPNGGSNGAVLTYLLDQRIDNAGSKIQYNTALHLACLNINTLPIYVFKYLIKRKGCDVNALNSINRTPIHCALSCFNPANRYNADVLTYLLSQESINTNPEVQSGDTLLHCACKNINMLPLDVFKLLIETKGCDLNLRDNNKNTPLCYALYFFQPGSDFTVLDYLLNQKGVKFHITGKFGQNLLHLACCCGLPGFGDDFWSPRPIMIEDETGAEIDTFWSQIVEIIVQQCLQQGFDGETPYNIPK